MVLMGEKARGDDGVRQQGFPRKMAWFVLAPDKVAEIKIAGIFCWTVVLGGGFGDGPGEGQVQRLVCL